MQHSLDETLQFGQILAQHPTAKEISFAHYMGQSYYRLETGEQRATYLVVDGEGFSPLALNEEEVLSNLQGLSLGIEVKTARIHGALRRALSPAAR